MKRNKLFLLGLFVVFAAVLSLSLVSSTFAKYVTTGTSGDSARVAKWGVTIAATDADQLFADDYNGSVISKTALDDVLAPGTAGTFGGFTVVGSPEVSVKVSYKATVALTGWEVDSAYYCPVVIKVNGTPVDKGASASAYAENIKDAIEAVSSTYTPNTNLADAGDDLQITWEWAFEGDDVKDTALGDAATASTISISVICTIEQID